jgi:hypothetical protein
MKELPYIDKDLSEDGKKLLNAYEGQIERIKLWRILFILTTIALIIALVGAYVYIDILDKKQNHKLLELEKVLVDTNIEGGTLKSQLKKLENIKTNDDFMLRDIEVYILSRYRRVPKIVAHTLAISIVETCKAEDVSPELVMGIIEIESQFNPMARNEKSGAIGLMQIMPEWSKKLGMKSVYDLYDIPVNIDSGIKILKIHINEDAKGNLEKGLYFYVGKDSSYASKVFQAAGKFAIFRSTVDDDEKKDDQSEDEEEKAAEGVNPEAKEPKTNKEEG